MSQYPSMSKFLITCLLYIVMENPSTPRGPGKKNLWIGIIAVVVVVVIVGSFVGLDYSHLFPSKKVTTTTSSQQILYVYPGVSGPANSDHLLGGCVIAEMKGGADPAASAQLMAYLLNPAVQKACEEATGFIPVDLGSYTTSPSTTVPTIWSPSNSTVTVYYYSSISTADEPYVTGVLNNFMKAYPNIVVKSSFVEASDIITDISSLVSASSTENVVMTIDNLDVGTLFYDGYLANLTSCVNTITDGAGVISTIQSLNQYEVHVFGGTYFLTQLVNIPLVWINYSAMTKAGITTPPTTYAQLLTDAQKLYNFYNGTGMVNFQGHGGASTPTELYQWLVQFGGNPMVFNDTGDIQAMEYIYNLSKYFSPDYKTSYWATYTGLASNTYTIMYYQWPGSVNLTELSMKPYNSTDTALNESLSAMKGGVFLRDPVPWISEWNTIMDSVWTDLIVDHASFGSIVSELNSANSQMYSFLESHYPNTTIPQEYEEGYFQPVAA